MILVVFGHVLLSMGFPTDSTVLGSILLTFRMPLFFFVSGFFAFRIMEKWTLIMTKTIMKRKIQAQVIATLFFYALFQFCHNDSPLLFLDDGFSWFWFTVVLFQMFIIYAIIAILERTLGKPIIVTPALIILSVILFICHVRNLGIDNQLSTILSWYYLTEYFQFFVIGILSRKYYDHFVSLLESNVFRTLVILSYIAFLLISYGFNRSVSDYNSTIYNFVTTVLVRYSGLFTIFILFFNNKDYFSGNDRTCRWLRFVGTRTLDIYMLHVFILPNLLFLKPLLVSDGMFLLQLSIGMLFAILDIAVCLFISMIIRSSSTLSQWLFGEKEKTTLNKAVIIP